MFVNSIAQDIGAGATGTNHPLHPWRTLPPHSLVKMNADTIVALCTGTPPTAVAMVRLSGPDAYRIAGQVFAPFEPEPRRAAYGRFAFGDDGLALPFPRGASYTGEETVELTLHGGRASVDALLGACLRAGARPARGGEFTLRAFANGRLDLTQAEAVVETVDAQTAQELRAAHRNREGSLRRSVEAIREDLRALLAEVEARIDFSEELGDLDPAEVARQSALLSRRLDDLTISGRAVHLARRGRRVALVGRPNAGKSSLLNALVGHDRAIVTDVPGTTRDTLEETVTLGAARLVLVDTAGIRETDERVEAEGIARTRNAMRGADEVWMLYDATRGWSPEDEAMVGGFERRPDLFLATKADLIVDCGLWTAEASTTIRNPQSTILLSVVTREGMDRLAARYPEPPETAPVNDRQAAALVPAARALREAGEIPDAPPDLLAVLLREADRYLGTVLGDAVPADLLNELFARFCVGK